MQRANLVPGGTAHVLILLGEPKGPLLFPILFLSLYLVLTDFVFVSQYGLSRVFSGKPQLSHLQLSPGPKPLEARMPWDCPQTFLDKPHPDTHTEAYQRGSASQDSIGMSEPQNIPGIP